MAIHIALLRGINVGGNSLLPMTELREICFGLGFQHVRTYIQSGNIIFESELTEKELLITPKLVKSNFINRTFKIN